MTRNYFTGHGRKRMALLAMFRDGRSTPLGRLVRIVGIRCGTLQSVMDSLEVNGYVLPEGWPVSAYRLTEKGIATAAEFRGVPVPVSNSEG